MVPWQPAMWMEKEKNITLYQVISERLKILPLVILSKFFNLPIPYLLYLLNGNNNNSIQLLWLSWRLSEVIIGKALKVVSGILK